jgi:hypothetical protein
MKQGRGSIWLMGALLALFASACPAPAWACPVTGRVGDAALVCQGKTPGARCPAHCAHAGGKCCKSLPLPPLPNGNPDEARDGGLLKVTPFYSAALIRLSAPSVSIGPDIAPLPEWPRVLAPLIEAPRFTASPPPFIALHRPASLAGRAPPVEESV